MAELSAPFPPGTYPVVVIGSGPGAIQASYSLRHLGVHHAVISADPSAGSAPVQTQVWPRAARTRRTNFACEPSPDAADVKGRAMGASQNLPIGADIRRRDIQDHRTDGCDPGLRPPLVAFSDDEPDAIQMPPRRLAGGVTPLRRTYTTS